LDRARAARRADRDRATLEPDQQAEREILDQFGIAPDALLGRGGEATVYGLDEDRVLRVYHAAHESTRQTIAQLQGLYRLWTGGPVEVPSVLENGERFG